MSALISQFPDGMVEWWEDSLVLPRDGQQRKDVEAALERLLSSMPERFGPAIITLTGYRILPAGGRAAAPDSPGGTE